MTIALYIIAACELVRMLQNFQQLRMTKHDSGKRDNLYAEFIDSLKQTDSEFVKRLIEEYEEQEPKEDK